jgi:transcriptional regulator with XRE-family HTH domain
MSALAEDLRQARRLPAPPVARAIRMAAGATQEQVAEQLGVDRVTVARWEAGARRPRLAMRLRYAQLLSELQELAVAN